MDPEKENARLREELAATEDRTLTRCGVHGCGYFGACPACYKIACSNADALARELAEAKELVQVYKFARDEQLKCHKHWRVQAEAAEKERGEAKELVAEFHSYREKMGPALKAAESRAEALAGALDRAVEELVYESEGWQCPGPKCDGRGTARCRYHDLMRVIADCRAALAAPISRRRKGE